MKKRLMIILGLMVSLSLLTGTGPLLVNDSDLLLVRGDGVISVVSGTLMYEHGEGDARVSLFSRNQGAIKIELTAEEGTYHVESWTIPSDPMNPQRIHEGLTIVVGDGGTPEPDLVDGFHLTALLAVWGPCTGLCPYDINGDGVVNGFDIVLLFAMWGQPWGG